MLSASPSYHLLRSTKTPKEGKRRRKPRVTASSTLSIAPPATTTPNITSTTSINDRPLREKEIQGHPPPGSIISGDGSGRGASEEIIIGADLPNAPSEMAAAEEFILRRREKKKEAAEKSIAVGATNKKFLHKKGSTHNKQAMQRRRKLGAGSYGTVYTIGSSALKHVYNRGAFVQELAAGILLRDVPCIAGAQRGNLSRKELILPLKATSLKNFSERLHKKFKRSHKEPLRDIIVCSILSVILDVCVALEHIHELGCIHADVNVRNILVCQQQQQQQKTSGPTTVMDSISRGFLADLGIMGPAGFAAAHLAPISEEKPESDAFHDIYCLGIVAIDALGGTRLQKRIKYTEAKARALALPVSLSIRRILVDMVQPRRHRRPTAVQTAMRIVLAASALHPDFTTAFYNSRGITAEFLLKMRGKDLTPTGVGMRDGSVLTRSTKPPPTGILKPPRDASSVGGAASAVAPMLAGTRMPETGTRMPETVTPGVSTTRPLESATHRETKMAPVPPAFSSLEFMCDQDSKRSGPCLTSMETKEAAKEEKEGEESDAERDEERYLYTNKENNTELMGVLDSKAMRCAPIDPNLADIDAQHHKEADRALMSQQTESDDSSIEEDGNDDDYKDDDNKDGISAVPNTPSLREKEEEEAKTTYTERKPVSSSMSAAKEMSPPPMSSAKSPPPPPTYDAQLLWPRAFKKEVKFAFDTPTTETRLTAIPLMAATPLTSTASFSSFRAPAPLGRSETMPLPLTTKPAPATIGATTADVSAPAPHVAAPMPPLLSGVPERMSRETVRHGMRLAARAGLASVGWSHEPYLAILRHCFRATARHLFFQRVPLKNHPYYLWATMGIVSCVYRIKLTAHPENVASDVFTRVEDLALYDKALQLLIHDQRFVARLFAAARLAQQVETVRPKKTPSQLLMLRRRHHTH